MRTFGLPNHGVDLARAATLLGCVAAMLWLWFGRAHAQEMTPEPLPTHSAEAETTRGLALGSGARASSLSTSALAYNPAALALGQLYHLEGNADYRPSNDQVALKAAIIDSMTSVVGAGLSFRGFLSTGDRGYDGFDVRLGLALPLSEAVSLGVTGRYLDIEQSLSGNGDRELAKGFNVDAALQVSPLDGLRILAVAYNVVDMDSFYAPVQVGGSVALSLAEALSISSDVLFDLTSYDGVEYLVGGGVEYLSAGVIPLRLGYRFDTGREVHSLTGGVGYTDEKVGVDLSLRQDVAGADDTVVMAALRYFVH